MLPGAAAVAAEWQAKVGNPSSMHAEGRRAKAAIDEAREVVARALECLFAEVVFTSSGTEAVTLAPEVDAGTTALGPELPALFCNDDALAAGLLDAATATAGA